ncbi:hypothetical protein [Nocardioides sp. B-3]|uniref:hypothetical protein n=1 Tax=Nocardioides sp. B-3 TaxID=2895565 RepID=UPI0021537EC6|nr:hypothetical protein [Nocardioides sp. B-3]UUZ61355.1 hypothetical protein LP418_12700 [Nocardioides sp. B-3]
MTFTLRLGAAAALAAAALTACSTGSTNDDADTATEPTTNTSAEADAYPVTIEHAFGETTINEEPARVATLGWTDHDHALALGVVPVGATAITRAATRPARPSGSTRPSRRPAPRRPSATTTPTAPRSTRSPSSPPT